MEESFGLQDYSTGERVFSVDPVCGMKVDEANAPGGKTRYAGQTYYFCSDGCRKTFDLDPAKIIGQRTE